MLPMDMVTMLEIMSRRRLDITVCKACLDTWTPQPQLLPAHLLVREQRTCFSCSVPYLLIIPDERLSLIHAFESSTPFFFWCLWIVASTLLAAVMPKNGSMDVFYRRGIYTETLVNMQPPSQRFRDVVNVFMYQF